LFTNSIARGGTDIDGAQYDYKSCGAGLGYGAARGETLLQRQRRRCRTYLFLAREQLVEFLALPVDVYSRRSVSDAQKTVRGRSGRLASFKEVRRGGGL